MDRPKLNNRSNACKICSESKILWPCSRSEHNNNKEILLLSWPKSEQYLPSVEPTKPDEWKAMDIYCLSLPTVYAPLTSAFGSCRCIFPHMWRVACRSWSILKLPSALRSETKIGEGRWKFPKSPSWKHYCLRYEWDLTTMSSPSCYYFADDVVGARDGGIKPLRVASNKIANWEMKGKLIFQPDA